MKAKTNKTRAEIEVERFNKWMRERIKNVHASNVQAMYLADKIVYDNFRGCLTVSGLALVPPCTNFNFSTKLSGGITPNPCYRIVHFSWVGNKQISK